MCGCRCCVSSIDNRRNTFLVLRPYLKSRIPSGSPARKGREVHEYTMSFKNLKSGLGITDEVKIKFTCAGINKIKNFIEQAEKLRELILSKKQDTISFHPDTLESMLQEIEANIQENAETYQNPKYNDDSTYYSKHWAVTDNVSSDIPLVLHIGIDYNVN